MNNNKNSQAADRRQTKEIRLSSDKICTLNERQNKKLDTQKLKFERQTIYGKFSRTLPG